MRLPAPRTSRVTVDRDVAVPMTDGAVLRHDHHRPAGVSRGPVVLVRSPYGRAGWIGVVFGRLVAERGLQVVVQSVRGTADSDGVLSPFDESSDGGETVALGARPAVVRRAARHPRAELPRPHPVGPRARRRAVAARDGHAGHRVVVPGPDLRRRVVLPGQRAVLERDDAVDGGRAVRAVHPAAARAQDPRRRPRRAAAARGRPARHRRPGRLLPGLAARVRLRLGVLGPPRLHRRRRRGGPRRRRRDDDRRLPGHLPALAARRPRRAARRGRPPAPRPRPLGAHLRARASRPACASPSPRSSGSSTAPTAAAGSSRPPPRTPRCR